AGNQATSPGVTINLSQMDVQTENGPGNVRGKPDSGDSITYTFGRPINPAMVLLGWDGSKPISCTAPALPGCVTVGILVNDRYDLNSHDSVQIFNDSERTATDP